MFSAWTWPLVVILLTILLPQHMATPWGGIHLPDEHIPYFFYNNPDIRKQCQRDEKCPYKHHVSAASCWGYEENCPEKNRMGTPTCTGPPEKWRKQKREGEQLKIFWSETDFGYIKRKKAGVKVYCKPDHPDDSLLECSSNLEFCRAKNLFIDFSNARGRNGRDQATYTHFNGEISIGGHCKLDAESLKNEGKEIAPERTLTSWGAEVGNYTSLLFRPIHDEKCDIIFDRPTYIMKLDSAANIYHHFCDFINLYVTQHTNNSFSLDVNLVMWDYYYPDKAFADVWMAFSQHGRIHLRELFGKRVCFRNAIFSFLPRLRSGLYYTVKPIEGCQGSSLVRAFSQHVLYRLNRTQDGPVRKKIRITFLTRSTKRRRILNEDKLIMAMQAVTIFDVRSVDYKWTQMPILEQLQISCNTDILMGIHGAGLTHMLFLPDWAAVFEIYNCEDPLCYYNLARLRGVKYFTWENSSKIVPEVSEDEMPKFKNYKVDVNEFMNIVHRAAEHVRTHPEFSKAQAKLNSAVDQDKVISNTNQQEKIDEPSNLHTILGKVKTFSCRCGTITRSHFNPFSLWSRCAHCGGYSPWSVCCAESGDGANRRMRRSC